MDSEQSPELRGAVRRLRNRSWEWDKYFEVCERVHEHEGGETSCTVHIELPVLILQTALQIHS